ncbi:MAG: hypothetical protein JW924_03225 [Fusobacteriaceae bacterium]|nr:hypothetical protein [Fusobacteriaceae bacterium]
MGEHELRSFGFANIYIDAILLPLEGFRCLKCGKYLFKSRETGYRVYLEDKYGEEINGECEGHE